MKIVLAFLLVALAAVCVYATSEPHCEGVTCDPETCPEARMPVRESQGRVRLLRLLQQVSERGMPPRTQRSLRRRPALRQEGHWRGGDTRAGTLRARARRQFHRGTRSTRQGTGFGGARRRTPRAPRRRGARQER
ncbi:hypothetical protein MTO96_048079 [Rhipicephalus appendiculatus]